MAGEARTAKMYVCATTDWGCCVTRWQSLWSVCVARRTLATKGVSMGYPQSTEVYMELGSRGSSAGGEVTFAVLLCDVELCRANKRATLQHGSTVAWTCWTWLAMDLVGGVLRCLDSCALRRFPEAVL